ncbi:hypothetical protein SDC9_155498 [bioreactor metagenome]|uniref:Uncharacterized protein n=1 Tax=bioreactor metagenome TaxID=1076179 RepID=A0A645F3J8_9ZZZZ
MQSKAPIRSIPPSTLTANTNIRSGRVKRTAMRILPPPDGRRRESLPPIPLPSIGTGSAAGRRGRAWKQPAIFIRRSTTGNGILSIPKAGFSFRRGSISSRAVKPPDSHCESVILRQFRIPAMRRSKRFGASASPLPEPTSTAAETPGRSFSISTAATCCANTVTAGRSSIANWRTIGRGAGASTQWPTGVGPSTYAPEPLPM